MKFSWPLLFCGVELNCRIAIMEYEICNIA